MENEQRKRWMYLAPRASGQYTNGVENFLDFAFEKVGRYGMILCPCSNCKSMSHLQRGEVYDHLICNGFQKRYLKWIYHGEVHEASSSSMRPNQEGYFQHDMHGLLGDLFQTIPSEETSVNISVSEVPHVNSEPIAENDMSVSEVPHVNSEPMAENDMSESEIPHGSNSEPMVENDQRKYNDLLRDVEQKVYPDAKYNKLSCLVHLFHLKCLNGWSNKSFSMLLEFLHDLLPEGNLLPKTTHQVKKILSNLGLGYEKIHACPNGCILFWEGNKKEQHCPICGASRWKPTTTTTTANLDEAVGPQKNKAANILRWFPLKPRLQRLFLSSKTASLMKWHQLIDVLSELDGVDFLSQNVDRGPWKKKSIFFMLPYWKNLLLRHNLDVMHIEKNICDKIVGTLLGQEGKSKDNMKARLDLQKMGIRKELHPKKHLRSNNMYMQKACYEMTRDEKDIFLTTLESIKPPDEYSSNISRCVHLNERKLTGMKSYDSHMLMQEYLPIALRGVLPDHVSTVVIELCNHDNLLKSQNSGVVVTVMGTSNTQKVRNYYGSLKDIIELNYSGKIRVVLFKCDWVDINRGCKRDKFGVTLVNFSYVTHTGENLPDDPFVFASQVDKVFYAQDPKLEGWLAVRHVKVRDAFNMGCNADQNSLYSISRTFDVPNLHRVGVDGDDEIAITPAIEDEDSEEDEDLY